MTKPTGGGGKNDANKRKRDKTKKGMEYRLIRQIEWVSRKDANKRNKGKPKKRSGRVD